MPCSSSVNMSGVVVCDVVFVGVGVFFGVASFVEFIAVKGNCYFFSAIFFMATEMNYETLI